MERMNDKLRHLIEDKADELGWSVSCDDEGGWEFSKNSPAGEDFSFYVGGGDIVKDIYEYYEGFDPDEHAKMWIEAQGRVEGVPSSIRTLIDDAEDIDEMLKELADALVDVEQGLPGEDEEDEEDGD